MNEMEKVENAILFHKAILQIYFLGPLARQVAFYTLPLKTEAQMQLLSAETGLASMLRR